jgi:hypothetical protein
MKKFIITILSYKEPTYPEEEEWDWEDIRHMIHSEPYEILNIIELKKKEQEGD